MQIEVCQLLSDAYETKQYIFTCKYVLLTFTNFLTFLAFIPFTKQDLPIFDKYVFLSIFSAIIVLNNRASFLLSILS